MKIIDILSGKKRYIDNCDKCIAICNETIEMIEQFRAELHEEMKTNG